MYVADGHHRTAAAYNVGKKRRQEALDAGIEVTGEEPFNFFMTLFYPADNLLIQDYNRVLKSLNGYSTEEFMTLLKDSFLIEPIEDGKTSAVERKHTYSLYLDSRWYKMELRPEKLDQSTPVSQLDS